jgi:hypothetical protein
MNNNKTQHFPAAVLREQLRTQALELAEKLARSVGRVTSWENLPCLEYGEEVQKEYALAQRMFYLQQCRDAVEHCIDGKNAVVRYRWPDGTVSRTSFRLAGPNRIRVTGLL